MTPRNIFVLAVRLLGLFFIYLALKGIPAIFISPAAIPSTLFIVIYYIIVGLWLMSGANSLLKRLYPE
jgi:hypothetical protein